MRARSRNVIKIKNVVTHTICCDNARMHQSVLLAWIGMTDLRASRGELGDSLGPIGQGAGDRAFAKVHLLSDHDSRAGSSYANWLKDHTDLRIQVHPVKLSGPTQFGEIYEAALSVIDSVHRAADAGK